MAGRKNNNKEMPPAPPLAMGAPPYYYPGAVSSSSVPNTSPIHWPLYTPPPEALLSFGQFSPMHSTYNIPPPAMSHPEQGYQSLENLHFVGATSSDSLSTPPPPPQSKEKKVPSTGVKVASSSSKRKRNIINTGDDVVVERTVQRMSYTPEEYERLASAWLECSTDPIDGNGKKGEKFWDDIAALYNSTTPNNRKRDPNHLKQEWQRTKKRLSLFHGAWVAVTSVYHSGYKPEDLEKLALEKYEANNGHPFQHLTLWAKLKAEGKWLSCYNKMKGNEEKSPSAGTNLATNAVDLDGEERPPGRDTSKVERTSKGKSGVSQELGERLDKFIEVSNQSAEDRQKVIESQLLLSNRQLETAKINSRAKLMDSYTNLLLADTSKMDDFEKAQRVIALKHMQTTLFADSGDQGEQNTNNF
ncbi:hypothetical protein ACQJBY_005869 [Aegilops geniculata]